jgi:hypothetical protein
MTIQRFAGILGHQLITISSSCSKSLSMHSNETEKGNIVPASLVLDSFSLNVSSISDNCADTSPTMLIPTHSLADCQGVTLAGFQLVSVVQLTKPQEITLKITLMKLFYRA